MYCTNCGSELSGNKCLKCNIAYDEDIIKQLDTRKSTSVQSEEPAVKESITMLQAKVNSTRAHLTSRGAIYKIQETPVTPIPKAETSPEVSTQVVDTGKLNTSSADTISDSPKQPNKVRPKRATSYLLKIFIWILAIPFTLFAGLYILWMVSDTRNPFKVTFTAWSAENLSPASNKFLFETLALNNFYKAPVVIDYTGIYKSTVRNDEVIELSSKGYDLSGKYYTGTDDRIVKGFIDKNGNYLLMEYLGGVPSGVLQGRIFYSQGFMKGNRYHLDRSAATVLSFEKINGSDSIRSNSENINTQSIKGTPSSELKQNEESERPDEKLLADRSSWNNLLNDFETAVDAANAYYRDAQRNDPAAIEIYNRLSNQALSLHESILLARKQQMLSITQSARLVRIEARLPVPLEK